MKKEYKGYKVGDTIKIDRLHDDMSKGSYDGREGVINMIDDIGQLHGTWGGLALIVEVDDFHKVENDKAFPKCKVCGGTVELKRYIPEVEGQMVEHCLCHSCLFWENHYKADKEGRKHWIINGKHYIPKNPTSDYFQGFGGRKFYVKYLDGSVDMSRNVWFQGDIPKEFREKMPDNAVFISEEEYNKLKV